ncbi:MAG: peroxidase family protein, partial [Microcystaceae cyanobacterium]
DHDLDLNEPEADAPSRNISVNQIDIATGQADPLYSPFGIPFTPNSVIEGTGTDLANPAQHSNKITSYLDGSVIYGSSQTTADALRTFSEGKLKMQTVNGEHLLPFITEADVPVSNPLNLPESQLFASGDQRVNEQVSLIAIHTVMAREHNRLATEIKARLGEGEPELVQAFTESGLSEDEFIYQSARKVVGAQIQIITYDEFLPLLVGDHGLTAYQGYDDTINASVSEEFANAAYRFGHTTLSSSLLRVDNDYQVLDSISLVDAFFNTQDILDNGIDELLLGLAYQESQAFDPFLVDEVRNFLFPAASGGSDLASVNIERGRDVGLGSLNEVRIGLGLSPYSSFAEISTNPIIVDRLSTIYDSVDDIDLWLGGLAENPYNPYGILGETFAIIIKEQFTRLRDGDRFFYLNDLEALRLLDPDIESTTLSQIIVNNSTVTAIQSDAFRSTSVPESSSVISLLSLGFLGLIFSFSRSKHKKIRSK